MYRFMQELSRFDSFDSLRIGMVQFGGVFFGAVRLGSVRSGDVW